MRKIQVLAVMLMAAGSIFAQAGNGEGKITYEQKINVHKRLPPEAEQMKAMIPEFQTNRFELYFTPATSLYKMAKVEESQLPSAEGGNRMTMRFGGMAQDAEIFRDYENETLVESRELGPKRYLIEDTLRGLKWKLEEETMTVAGYVCRKATATITAFGMGGMMRAGGGGNRPEGQQPAAREGQTARRDSMMTRMANERQTVVAWYTEQIPTAAGPDNYFGLPGLVLYVDIDNGTIVYTPVKLEPLAKDMAIKAPTKGSKITREEYRKLMQQQFQGMRGGPGTPAGGMMIIRQ